MPVTASDACRVALDIAQQLPGAVGQLAVALEHQPPLHEISCRVDQHAFRLEPVAPGPARLLLIMLERLRRPCMDDEADV
jgi:hypothetical protein